MNNNHYDVIIVGTGAGGATLAYQLAPSGKKILVLERGNFLPREKANWNPQQVLQAAKYRNGDTWYDNKNKPIHTNSHYYVGGNTKFYGGTLFRFRERDFEQVTHYGGVSPEWILKYSDLAPYYTQAEKLYEVHGQTGLDPTEPPKEAYPFPPITHEPHIQAIYEGLKDKNFHPFYLPLSIKLNQTSSLLSACIRCDTCDGFPCFLNAKAEADINCMRPAMKHSNITLMVSAKVTRLHTSTSGREVTGVEVEVGGRESIHYSANIVVLACGAVNSALLLLKSANDQHPNGLANSSGLVGRNYMAHKFGVVLALSTQPNPTVFQKTMGFNDFYWGEKDFPYPMGSVQSLGNIHTERVLDNASFIPRFIAEKIANHCVPWLLITEDLPDFKNRVYFQDGKIRLEYTSNNNNALNRLIKRWIAVLKSIDKSRARQISIYHAEKMTVKEVGHQCGTCRFGEDPQTSVLDINCRAHDIDNLYVVDSSFFPSSGAMNPSLTIMANALRVGEHLLTRLK
jgi:choline dehydrogenase-like flavoprotein